MQVKIEDVHVHCWLEEPYLAANYMEAMKILT